MTSNIELSLRPQAQDEEIIPIENWSLAQLIPRIITERGSFADITEDALQREIEEASLQSSNNVAVEEDVEMEEDQDEDSKDSEDRKTFHERRMEMMHHIKNALNESALSLDFVSLLLSCQRPAAGTTSMSPLLKQRVAVGSLGADLLWTTVAEEDPKVSAGWKLKSLTEASRLLKEASDRLETEIDNEETYWKGISELAYRGEALFKIRKGELRGLGVKYGFTDAGSDYHKNKGIAIVKRNSNGTMSFKYDTPLTNKVVRVTLYDIVDGEKRRAGSSTCSSLGDTGSPLAEIQSARTQIFEEELFFEMIREQRLLASLQLSVVEGKIVIALYDEILEIEYTRVPEDEDVHLFPSSTRADFINQALHVLLSYVHKRNLEKRQKQLPVPINSKVKKSNPPLFILRPIVAHLLHSKILKRTSRNLEMILVDNGLAPDDLKLELYSTVGEKGDKTELGTLLYPPSSKYSFECKGVKVEITTISPVQSHEPLYTMEATKVETGEFISKTGVYELIELEEWLRWLLRKSLVSN